MKEDEAEELGGKGLGGIGEPIVTEAIVAFRFGVRSVGVCIATPLNMGCGSS